MLAKPVGLFVAVLLAACSPRWDRALVLDLALSDPAIIDAVAEPWDAAGYTVEYRRFYPHLTHADLDRYQMVILLGGREPEAPSDGVTAGDLALLYEWLTRGGIVVWGYTGDGEGFADRWTMNRWLAWVGAGITVGDYPLRDTTERGPQGLFEAQPRAAPVSRSALRGAGVGPFPLGRNHALVVQDPRQALARATPGAFVRIRGGAPEPRPLAPVVAARRIGQGLILVTSRHALGALGPELRPSTLPATALDEAARTRTYLLTLGRWTRRPAQWALVPPAGLRDSLDVANPAIPMVLRPPPAAAPPGAQVVRVPLAFPEDSSPRPAVVPTWLDRQGLRALWGRFPGFGPGSASSDPRADIDSIVAFLDVGGFNALVSDATAPPQPIADTVRPTARRGRALAAAGLPAAPIRLEARGRWRALLERLETTSLRWIPAVDPADLSVPQDTGALDLRGRRWRGWCPLDSVMWQERIIPAYRTLAHLAAERPDLIPAVILELDTEPSAFCGTTFFATVDTLVAAGALAPAQASVLASLPPDHRYAALLESGLLGAYHDALERAVARRAARARDEARRIQPGLLFGVRRARWPADWFSIAVLRGLAGPDEDPLLLWTREARAAQAVRQLRARGVPVVHATGLSPRRLAPGDWARLRRAAFRESDGFWLASSEEVLAGPRMAAGPLSADSLARLIRRLAKER